MLNAIKILIFLAFLLTGGCAGGPSFKRADIGKLMDTASVEVDRVADTAALAADLIDLGCAIRETHECAEARVALGVANDAIAKARAALAEARTRNDRFWFAADMVERAVTAGAEALTAARKVVGR